MTQATAVERMASFVVDSSMYEGPPPSPADVYGDLDRVVRTDLYYHYSTPICAQRWLDVCADPQYGHQELMQRAEQVLPLVMEALGSGLRAQASVTLVSLGTGDGEFDARILSHLVARLGGASYYGLDFSFDLLRRAVHRVAMAVEANGPVPILARCGDFTNLRTLDAALGVPAPRLFSLTGFTLGNYSEPELLAQIRAKMGPEDYLFLDARLHAFGADARAAVREASAMRTVLTSYDLASVRRFVFGPVEVATLATERDVEIGFEFAEAMPAVPNALNMQILCRGLDTTMRLTRQPVWRDRLDLAVTTCYDLADLTTWIERQGLRVAWRGAAEDVAFFLLRRTA